MSRGRFRCLSWLASDSDTRGHPTCNAGDSMGSKVREYSCEYQALPPEGATALASSVNW